MVLHNDVFEFNSVGGVRLSPYYEQNLYQYVEGNVYKIFSQNVLKTLNGVVKVTGGQNQTIVIKLQFTMHCNSRSVGMVISEEQFATIDKKEIADYLTESFVYFFGNMALSAFLNPLSKEERE